MYAVEYVEWCGLFPVKAEASVSWVKAPEGSVLPPWHGAGEPGSFQTWLGKSERNSRSASLTGRLSFTRVVFADSSLFCRPG